jgi:hypothetical protein
MKTFKEFCEIRLNELNKGNLMFRAKTAIRNKEPFIFDIAAEKGQMVDNVKHMPWFELAVAQWLIDNEEQYSHLSLDSLD